MGRGGSEWENRLTRAVSVAGRRSAVGRVGEEGGQAGVVCVLAGEEGLTLLPRCKEARLRGETSQRVCAEQSWGNPVGLL